MLHKSVTSASTSVRAFVALFIAAALCVVAAGCSGGSGGGGGDDKTLNILTWETYDDPAWLDQFTEDTGIKVNAVNVGSPAKVKANPGDHQLLAGRPLCVRQQPLDLVDRMLGQVLVDFRQGARA